MRVHFFSLLCGIPVAAAAASQSPGHHLREHKRVLRALNPKLTVAAVAALTTRAGATQGKATPLEKPAISASWPTFSAFLYFLACAFTIPVLPKIVNELVGKDGAATGKSVTTYGFLNSIDQTFTFLTVNLWATISDRFGRRPLMALSTIGLGTGFAITSTSHSLRKLMLAATIDGCTSCMFAIAQAGVSDCSGTGPKLSTALGVFQGLAVGMAFLVGLPFGGVLGAKKGKRWPMAISVGLCAANLFFVGFLMPETLPKAQRTPAVRWKSANPVGAVRTVRRNGLVTGLALVYMLHWIAHSGLQVNWINYTDRKFNLPMSQSSAALAMMGIIVAAVPKLLIPRLGEEKSVRYGLLVYAVGQLLIAAAPKAIPALVVLGLALSAAGTIAFPAVLGILTNQVPADERGALQGAMDTVKTLTSMIATPAMASLFGYFISEHAPREIEGASYYAGAVFGLLAWVCSVVTFHAYGRRHLGGHAAVIAAGGGASGGTASEGCSGGGLCKKSN